MSFEQLAHAVGALDGIYKTCAIYMTDKSFKATKASGATARRKQRYDAFERLLQIPLNHAARLTPSSVLARCAWSPSVHLCRSGHLRVLTCRM
jgi:hypothetical protein